MNKAFEQIIERLEAESFERRIPVFTERAEMVIDFDTAKQIVQEVAEEYNGGWIACSERLPEYGEVVMCSCTNSGITISCITHKGVKPSKSVRFGQHSVIAWQPLPEPYKERD